MEKAKLIDIGNGRKSLELGEMPFSTLDNLLRSFFREKSISYDKKSNRVSIGEETFLLYRDFSELVMIADTEEGSHILATFAEVIDK